MHLGPLAIAPERLLVVLAVWTFWAIARRLDRGDVLHGVLRASTWATVVGFAAARITYVARHADLFGLDPLSALAFWQGGFDMGSGVIAALVTLLVMRRTWRPTLMAASALLVLVGAFIGATAALHADQPSLPEHVRFTSIDGAAVALDNMRGAPLVINVWTSWCPPCRAELPMLTSAAATSPVRIVLLNSGEDQATVRAYLASQHLDTTHVALDTGGALMRALDASSYPTTLFVDAGGKIVETHVGELSRAGLRDGIEAAGGRGF